MFLFLLAFMGTFVAIKHGGWNNLHPLAMDIIASKTTIIAVLVYSMVVMSHEKHDNDMGDYLIISYNIRFLSATLAVTTLSLILIQPFGPQFA